jgi:CDP-glycerol glycerophosphotransferase (TagB/SpsB family)
MEDSAAGSRIALFASQPFVQGRVSDSPWDRHEILRSVATVADLAGVALVVKWHPSETPEPLPVSQPVERSIRQFHRADTLELIRKADVVMAVSSTVALEAIILDRPVIFLGPLDPDSPFHPPEDGGGLRALRGDDLSGFLGRLMADARFREETLRGQRDYLRRYYTPLDGHAADRVVDFLTRG